MDSTDRLETERVCDRTQYGGEMTEEPADVTSAVASWAGGIFVSSFAVPSFFRSPRPSLRLSVLVDSIHLRLLRKARGRSREVLVVFDVDEASAFP